jgi:hypothetical protein
MRGLGSLFKSRRAVWAAPMFGIIVLTALPVTSVIAATGSSWKVVKSPDPRGANDSVLYSVSCASESFCMAAGRAHVPNKNPFYRSLIEEWNGSTWRTVASPDPSGSSGFYNWLYGVSCQSASLCMAVGFYGNAQQTLVEQWNGETWSVVPSPNPNANASYLNGVSCTSPTFCAATGYYYSGSFYQTLIEEWNGIDWAIVASPNSSVTQHNYLQAVSCSGPSFCIATGQFNNGSNWQTLIEERLGGDWTLLSSPNATAGGSLVTNQLFGVSCASSKFCIAVGQYQASNTAWNTLIESWNGLAWTVDESQNAPSASFNTLYDVSCTSATFCMASGESDPSTIIEGWNGLTWNLLTSANVTGAQDNLIYGVSCPTVSFCQGTGYYNTSTLSRTLIEQWRGRR